MKTTRIILIIAVLAAMTAACTKEEKKEREITPIDVKLLVDGQQTDTLKSAAAGALFNVDVDVNSTGLRWSVETDKNWCTIENGEGTGSARFKLIVDPNENTKNRDTATVTFIAGEYIRDVMKVTQTGSDYVISRSYFAVAKDGKVDQKSSAPILLIKTVEGKLWELENQPEWLTTKIVISKTQSMVTMTFAANDGPARYHTMSVKDSDSGESVCNIDIFQFGNEYEYDASGAILLPGDKEASIYFKAPEGRIGSLNLPDYITLRQSDEGDKMTGYTITFPTNFNDCSENRNPKITALLSNKLAITMPAIVQAYCPAGGLTSAKGLTKFAEVVNAGGDISEWQTDGVVHMLNNIDMSSVKSWESIGTEAHPFTGEFDGTFHTILGMKSGNPLFGVCQDAKIHSLILNNTCTFSKTEDPLDSETSIYLSPVAGKIKSTTVQDCVNGADVTYARLTEGNDASIYVSGLVGYADEESKIISCTNNGKVSTTAACKAPNGSNTALYLGGVAGKANGNISKCVNTGAVADDAAVKNHYIGGIAAFSAGSVTESSSEGTFTISSKRGSGNTADQSLEITVGGIVGRGEDATVSNNTNKGALNLSTTVKTLYAGGIGGNLSAEGELLDGNTSSGAISNTGGVLHNYLGGLYGALEGNIKIDFNSDLNACTGGMEIKAMDTDASTTLHVGGLIGGIRGGNFEFDSPAWNQSMALDFSYTDYKVGCIAVGGILGGSMYTAQDDEHRTGLTLKNAQNIKGMIEITCGHAVFGAKITSFAGIVGMNNGPATLSGCTSSGEVSLPSSPTNSNGYSIAVAGVVGRLFGGNSSLKNCNNTGGLRNWNYNNNAYNGSTTYDGMTVYSCSMVAGVLGGAMTIASSTDNTNYTVELDHCTNSGYAYSYRGMAAGIAGFVRNATIKDCTNKGSLGSGNRSYPAGIVSVAYNTNISNCTAVCGLTGASYGSELYTSGGIASFMYGTGSVVNCSYFGDIKCTVSNDITREKYAFIVAVTDESAPINIQGCRFGGTLSGLGGDKVVANEENFADYVFATGAATASECSYWNGEE